MTGGEYWVPAGECVSLSTRVPDAQCVMIHPIRNRDSLFNICSECAFNGQCAGVDDHLCVSHLRRLIALQLHPI